MKLMNEKRDSNYHYQPGDLILIKNHQPNKNESRFLGPYKIHSCEENYVILDTIKREKVNLKRLKPYLTASQRGQNIVSPLHKTNSRNLSF
ncbi:hypothetical protein A0H76_2919 [Hepatospora eriocheir]|uniref:POL4 n=1 Tax=Hepatospora eriocheir TaxID=1081669 RepID=A0A1X0Q5I4_9MICR|nr:hypothetical protein A0H76_2919 [Hepatospora eriocheir]